LKEKKIGKKDNKKNKNKNIKKDKREIKRKKGKRGAYKEKCLRCSRSSIRLLEALAKM
jgi:hypothetical protein